MSFREVLHHAGITKLVLHAWERRYGLDAFQRTATNRRLYTFEQAERLRLLKVCTDAGCRIGSIVDLSLEELGFLEQQAMARARIHPAIQLLTSQKLEELEAWLVDQATRHEVTDFIFSTVAPLMQEVGKLWSEKSLSIADEHFVTACIKRILLRFFDRLAPVELSAPWLIATTPEGETHEMGALCAAILGRYAGWNAVYLGPSLPVSEIAQIAARYKARCICLSITTFTDKRFQALLGELHESISQKTDIVVGGAFSNKVFPEGRLIFIKNMQGLCSYFAENLR